MPANPFVFRLACTRICTHVWCIDNDYGTMYVCLGTNEDDCDVAKCGAYVLVFRFVCQYEIGSAKPRFRFGTTHTHTRTRMLNSDNLLTLYHNYIIHVYAARTHLIGRSLFFLRCRVLRLPNRLAAAHKPLRANAWVRVRLLLSTLCLFCPTKWNMAVIPSISTKINDQTVALL